MLHSPRLLQFTLPGTLQVVDELQRGQLLVVHQGLHDLRPSPAPALFQVVFDAFDRVVRYDPAVLDPGKLHIALVVPPPLRLEGCGGREAVCRGDTGVAAADGDVAAAGGEVVRGLLAEDADLLAAGGADTRVLVVGRGERRPVERGRDAEGGETVAAGTGQRRVA